MISTEGYLSKELTLIPEFTIPGRKFRYDIKVGTSNVLGEVQGGIFAKRRYGHSTGEGIQRDIEKLRHAVYNGFTLVQFSSKDLTKEKIDELIQFVLATNI